jgi:hypothetical protein
MLCGEFLEFSVACYHSGKFNEQIWILLFAMADAEYH